MMKPHIRKHCGDVLTRLGIVQLQTVHEKYDKAFDKLTLTQEERLELAEKIKQRYKNDTIFKVEIESTTKSKSKEVLSKKTLENSTKQSFGTKHS